MSEEKVEDILLVKEISTRSIFLDEKIREDFFEFFKETPFNLIQYQMIIERVNDVVFFFMPIINYSFGSSKLIFRAFIFNLSDEAIRYEYGVDTKPIPEKKPKLDLGSINIPASKNFYLDLEFKDLTVIGDFLYLSIGRKLSSKEINHEIQSKTENYIYQNLKLPITRIVKPKTYKELVNLRFVGLTAKPYVDLDSISKILSVLTFEQFDFIMELILVLCCCMVGIGICYLPFYITSLTQMKKKFFTKEDLVNIQLTEANIQNPSKEWNRDIKRQRKQVLESLKKLDEKLKQKRIAEVSEQLKKLEANLS